MINYQAFAGIVTAINDFSIGQYNEVGCYKLMSVDNGYGNVVNFVVAPTTYFVDHEVVSVGDQVTGFYDGDAPAPLIFPPQFSALIVSKNVRGQFVKVDHFDDQLVSSDHTLQLNMNPATKVVLQNGQPFTGNLANRDLLVVYGATTRSIPAQTTPYQIVVLCS
ncbi:hypothetical protein [Sporosarcina sp. ZBG7A]|uniref:hypothetical protein n=1 Tax=Sporosarcina sp. ZBG7A TaxID=1582223 RepID=UPI00057B59F7|nr:hypothetical protein [Sporosarcina sp. ZBG7A]